MPRATIDDVAKLAGVSIKTVSRVANGERSVRQSTREKVERAIAQLGYQPNFSARNLASQHSRLVVLVYDDPGRYVAPSASYVISLQNGALSACRLELRGYWEDSQTFIIEVFDIGVTTRRLYFAEDCVFIGSPAAGIEGCAENP